jgi:hypothetical protein
LQLPVVDGQRQPGRRVFAIGDEVDQLGALDQGFATLRLRLQPEIEQLRQSAKVE